MNEETLEADARARVAAGVAWLDEHRPDWRERVELRRFDIRSACRCVLGQVFEEDQANDDSISGYGYVLSRLILPVDRLIQLGFDAKLGGAGGAIRDFDRLQRAWTLELTADRAGAPS